MMHHLNVLNSLPICKLSSLLISHMEHCILKKMKCIVGLNENHKKRSLGMFYHA